ncbi:hypothetical protein MHYP_G00205840 [Metynnis hypsauchen]
MQDNTGKLASSKQLRRRLLQLVPISIHSSNLTPQTPQKRQQSATLGDHQSEAQLDSSEPSSNVEKKKLCFGLLATPPRSDSAGRTQTGASLLKVFFTAPQPQKSNQQGGDAQKTSTKLPRHWCFAGVHCTDEPLVLDDKARQALRRTDDSDAVTHVDPGNLPQSSPGSALCFSFMAVLTAVLQRSCLLLQVYPASS